MAKFNAFPTSLAFLDLWPEPTWSQGISVESARLRQPSRGRNKESRRSRQGAPELIECIDVTVELVAVAVADSADAVRLRPEVAVGVLPEGPGGPVGRYHGGTAILREPEEALSQDRILLTSKLVFY